MAAGFGGGDSAKAEVDAERKTSARRRWIFRIAAAGIGGSSWFGLRSLKLGRGAKLPRRPDLSMTAVGVLDEKINGKGGSLPIGPTQRKGKGANGAPPRPRLPAYAPTGRWRTRTEDVERFAKKGGVGRLQGGSRVSQPRVHWAEFASFLALGGPRLRKMIHKINKNGFDQDANVLS